MHTHLDASLSPEKRATALLGAMTLREKAFQITSIAPWNYVDSAGQRVAAADSYVQRGAGFICNFGVDDPQSMAATVGGLQRVAIEETRLGIPMLVQAEALSGFLSGGHMVFPTPTGLAATWSPDLVEAMTDVIRRQMTRVGVRHALSPNLDLGLDPRWGRVHETFGEDPYLTAAMGVAFVRGLQSDDLTQGVIATAKHFIGYGAPEGGSNLAAYEGGSRRTRDLHGFAFEAAIHLANLQSVMNSYSDVDAVPAGASRAVLTDLLRETFGFDGFVSADYGTIEQFVDRQRAALTPGEAGRLAIHAGLDTEFPVPFGFGEALAAEVEAGRADVADLDTAVHRVLTAKFRIGLFENPYPHERIDVASVAAEGVDVSRELARRSVVMLENDGILPLSPSAKIAVIGPHADNVVNQFATYSYPAFRDMMVHMSSGGMGNMIGVDPAMVEWNNTVFAGGPGEHYVRDRLGARSLGEVLAERAASVVVERGASLTADLTDAEFDRAVATADGADIVILALGGASLWFNGERTEGEGSDSADISLPAAQTRLADAVAATGTPVVTVLTQGRAYVLPESVRASRALVVAPFGGPFGPDAVADVLFGEVNPSGKLAYSIPRSPGQIPVYHHQRSGTGYRKPLPPDVTHHYLDTEATPLYGFARGESFTSFELIDLEADRTMTTDGSVRISATVRNTGGRAGATVVQLYAGAFGLGVTRPAQQLAGFQRVELDASASVRVSFEVQARQFGYTALDGAFTVDPGPLKLWMGFDSETPALATEIEVTGARLPLKSGERSFLSVVTVG
ncbi:glycoside hydrolase family 3 N-terminal domain-containing protein [Microbacterium terrae]|nr:glycoside hydrolase family 3 N-terminal domain-containing protein [Microbacterium terrae]